MYVTPAQKKALQAIGERRAVKLHLGTLASLKSRGWIQLALNDAPMAMAISYDLTQLGQQALDPHATSKAANKKATSPIGLEAETCEECGGSGRMLVLDEQELSDPCPWCQGSGRISSMLTANTWRDLV
ncbi:MAG: hypothetical protein HQL97_15260 [Magnetococcales bacterium]|nr:hypothetical protein [Magnetococcales bacterium]MBF0263187.1 hypothetical protein [Magnetococcales bacterium]